MRVTMDEVAVTGDAVVTWKKGAKRKTEADVSMKVRCVLTDFDDARNLNPILPGASMVYEAGTVDQDLEDPPDPVDSHVQRLSWPTSLVWTLSHLADDADAVIGEPVEVEAPVRSLTLTASKGTVVLTVGLSFTVTLADLPRVAVLDGAELALRGESRQQELALAQG